jgi:hypothetical protein
MAETNSWLSTSYLSLTALVLVVMAVMYLGRSAAHGAIRALASSLRSGMLNAAKSLSGAEERVARRNREVLLATGRDTTERLIEREFQRVTAVVTRDLSGYPALHRRLSDQLTRIEEDYRHSVDVPPSPPEWVKAVDTIAQIQDRGDSVVGKILEDIHKAIHGAHKSAMREYREASGKRHRLLEKMRPFWRSLDQTLGRVNATIEGLDSRAQDIDQQMQRYEEILKGSEKAERILSASSMTQFVASGLVLVIALLGGFINFHLIALPMSEMVGATSYVGPVKTSDIAALVIILTEIAMGLFLMESVRITRLFPVISTLDDRLRHRLVWVSAGILFTLACVEASLAYMRDLLAQDREALTQQLAGISAAQVQLRWIPSIGQMVMGFMLPFALTFVAIPLESFIHSSRIVLGAAFGAGVRALAASLQLAADMVSSLGTLLTHVFDILIIVPLKLEQLLFRRGASRDEDDERAAEQHARV